MITACLHGEENRLSLLYRSFSTGQCVCPRHTGSLHTLTHKSPHTHNTATPKKMMKIIPLVVLVITAIPGSNTESRVCWISCNCSIFTDTDEQSELNILAWIRLCHGLPGQSIPWQFVRLCQCTSYQKCPYMAVLSCATIEVENHASLAGFRQVQFNHIF